jgi:hypothetical protein
VTGSVMARSKGNRIKNAQDKNVPENGGKDGVDGPSLPKIRNSRGQRLGGRDKEAKEAVAQLRQVYPGDARVAAAQSGTQNSASETHFRVRRPRPGRYSRIDPCRPLASALRR